MYRVGEAAQHLFAARWSRAGGCEAGVSAVVLKDAAATAAFGGALARFLGPGDAVFLIGGLGAGKTTLARAVIHALTGDDDVPSPTYTLVQTYDGTDCVVWHCDLYRLEPAAAVAGDLRELGLDDAFAEAVVLVEWPDRLGAHAPADRLEIRLSPRDDGGRWARWDGVGAWRMRVDDEFCQALHAAGADDDA